ncbi:TadE/TadG family type IV pilus assembly protein [Arthrobacter celericrescens]|uniref:TadE/TadG family type IV pilus assembly protein n=1 Tax=Arthrobacter celericrescens TaxID=2320851 RepID=UPI000EA2DB2B|nr:pilus assembly protein TadG-related protein [Arthrobacter celericrescens]
MRRLVRNSKPRHRAEKSNAVNRERGAAGVTVALLLMVLVGAGAMAVDVGQIYVERGELQNGADAGAMAAAQLCAEADGCTQLEAEAAAANLANGNARDNASTVQSVDLSVANQVTVVTSTLSGTTNAGFLSKMFASALNAPPVTVGAQATAGLTFPGGGGAFPLAFSDECWDLSEAVDTGELQKISWKPGTTCTNPSGHTVPGGWGWLEDPDNDCYAVTTTGNVVGSDPGSDKPAQCATILQGWITALDSGETVEVTFPVFDSKSGTGSGAIFHIIGYATFSIVGWKFGNGSVYEYHNTTAALGNSNLACSAGNARCIIGQFVKYVTLEDAEGGGAGSGENLGTVVVKLIK